MHTLAQVSLDDQATPSDEKQGWADPVTFLQALIRCNSVNRQGDEVAVARLLADALQGHDGIELRQYPIEEGRCNFIARLRSERPGPRIVLSGHLDTVPVGNVPWTHEPFSGKLVDGRLYGRGAVDMKGGLAALLFAFRRMASEAPDSWGGELILAATSAEETGAEGATVMVDSGQLPVFDAMIIAEPTDNQLVITHKGVLWIRIVSHGKAAHGSMPSAGINAIDRILPLHARLRERLQWELTQPLLGAPTAATTMMRAGVQPNVIPDRCELTIDIRSLPGQDHESILQIIREEIQALHDADPENHFELQVLLDLPGLSTSPNSPTVNAALEVITEAQERPAHVRGAQYFTDACAFQRIGGDILIMGPGAPTLAHQVDEHIHIDDYLAAIEMYHKLLLALLAGK